MEIINGLRPRENEVTKAMIEAMSKRILEKIDDTTYQEREKKMMDELSKEWLPDAENLTNPLL